MKPDFTMNKNANPYVTGDRMYDLFQGYIDLEELLECKYTVRAIEDAISLLEDFLDTEELFEEM